MKPPPDLPSHLIHRPRLNYSLERLVAGERRIITMWAASGSGKSTLIQQWAREAATHNVDVTLVDRQALFNGASAFVEQVHRMNHDDKRSRQHIFIVQDVHLITSTGSRNSLLSIMHRLPANVSLVISGQYQPP